ncbi:metallophosphoesterase [Caproiciproducens sp. CPB-2]|uniref:metallophosphoesterase n=1 Tax=Caproiciproducens sp. CPB-2 TaxID=3030017 RepID=UPI0023DCC1A3|nr:metallophosphoesterase [Caproiciproducens sp. CPB-2]MDF1494975.1 metallophosphoesterase [Caproiciproducens sp. CPB-2]
MAVLFSLSDPHGEIETFKKMLKIVDLQDKENKLVLLGDYIDHKQKKFELLYFIKNLQEQYNDQIIILAGNHEFFLLEDIENKTIFFDDDSMINWLKDLPYYYETDTQIYVHAGIDEEAGEFWKWGSEDYYFCSKYPYTIGKFEKDIIAGHIGTSTITGNENYHKVFWDKQSHFYIDGTTELSKILPLLKYDTNKKRYSSFEKITDENDTDSWVEYTIK